MEISLADKIGRPKREKSADQSSRVETPIKNDGSTKRMSVADHLAIVQNQAKLQFDRLRDPNVLKEAVRAQYQPEGLFDIF